MLKYRRTPAFRMYTYPKCTTPISSSDISFNAFHAFPDLDPTPAFLSMPEHSILDLGDISTSCDVTTMFLPDSYNTTQAEEDKSPQTAEPVPDSIFPPMPTNTPNNDYESSNNEEPSKNEDIAPTYVLRPKSSRTEMSLTHSNDLQAIENVFAHIMPREIPNRLVRGGKAYPHYLIYRHVPAKRINPRTIKFTHQNIASTEWAESYPGCKLLIKFKPGTFPSAEQYRITAHLVMLTRGDRMIFDDYDPGFQYQLTRILHLDNDKYHVEMVAFNENGDFFSEASQAFFPCVIEIPTHLIDSSTFHLEDKISHPRLRRARRLYPFLPSQSLSDQFKAPLDPDTLLTFACPLPIYSR